MAGGQVSTWQLGLIIATMCTLLFLHWMFKDNCGINGSGAAAPAEHSRCGARTVCLPSKNSHPPVELLRRRDFGQNVLCMDTQSGRAGDIGVPASLQPCTEWISTLCTVIWLGDDSLLIAISSSSCSCMHTAP